MRLLFIVMFLLLCKGALAQENLNFNMTPGSIAKINQSQIERSSKIQFYKNKGQIGEAEGAMLAIREPKTIKADELAVIKKLVDEENKDRTVEINEIAKANKFDAAKKAHLIKAYFETKKGTDAKGTYFFESNVWQKKY